MEIMVCVTPPGPLPLGTVLPDCQESGGGGGSGGDNCATYGWGNEFCPDFW